MKLKYIYYLLGVLLVVFGAGKVLLGVNTNSSNANLASLNSLGVLHHLNILDMPQTQIVANTNIITPAPIAKFKPKGDNLPEPNITAQSALVVDFATGDILYNKNAISRYQLASITKLLSSMVVADEYRWGDNKYITMTQSAFDTYGGNSLRVGENFLLEDILSASLMASSNDATQLLAENFGGIEVFNAKMNKKAKDLGMNDSEFFNAHGLDQKPTSNYSTASDIMKLTQDLYDNYPDLMNVLKQKEVTIKSQDGRSVRVGNTNEMLGVSPQMLVAKTGLTDEAGETLSSVVSIQDRIIGIVVLKSAIGGYRFQDTRNLIKWIEDNYSI